MFFINLNDKLLYFMLNRGMTSRPLMESEIRAAQSISKSGAETARKLGCSYVTYKKYASLYGILDKVKNIGGRGVAKPYSPSKGKYPIEGILEGKFPNYPTNKIKIKLFRSGTKEEKCECCGYNEKRITDNQSPLLLNFLDGNKKNHKIENIQVLCYNCFHNQVGALVGPRTCL